MFITLALLFAIACDAACNTSYNFCTCTLKSTHIFIDYIDNWNGLFQSNTFGGAQEIDKCMDLGDKYRQNYLEILMDNNISCTGDWCKEDGNNNGFDCTDMGTNCYQVEHIIDRKNTPYDTCNTNILGNVIMAAGTWNNQLGNKCWNDIKREKIAVYGLTTFCKAIQNVISCSNGNCKIPLPNECIPVQSHIPTSMAGIIVGIIVGIILIGITIYCLFVYRDTIKQKFQNMFNGQRNPWGQL